jgi:hypothetical protein
MEQLGVKLWIIFFFSLRNKFEMLREALDHFLLFSEKQVRNIVSEFIEYYNTKRMHQGIDKIPDAEILESSGVIKKMKILSGLHHHYYRSSA